MTYARKRIGAWILAALLAAICVLLPGTATQTAKAEGDEPIEVATEEALLAVVDDLNANGGSATVLLTADVARTGNAYLRLSKGELTILGGGHTLTAAVLLSGTAVLNLGKDGDEEGLTVIPNRTDCGVFDLSNASMLNVYDGTVIGPATPIGTAGGVQAHNVSIFNMYGGTITGCKSSSVAGGVYLDGNAVFNMYGGTIKDCVGCEGGAVGLSGGSPIGGSPEGTTAFHMHGGTIKDCVDQYNGGGAVCAYTSYPVIVTMDGGTIKNCSVVSTNRNAYGGGGIMLFVFADLVFKMDGGKIIDNTCLDSKYKLGGGLIIYTTGSNVDIQLNKGTISGNSADLGGGIFAYKGAMTIKDGFGLHNNTALTAGDDIYNNGTDVNLGTVDTSATLESCGHKITGWYEDAEARWNYGECRDDSEHLVLFEHTGEVYAEEYGLKAAHGPLHTVTWVNEDGTVLQEETDVPEGEEPPYEGPEPTKEPSDGYEYTFTGWEKEVDEDTGNVTYRAVFEATPIPTEQPTEQPTEKPTAGPTEKPTAAPTAAPTAEPTAAPTAKPTEKPEPSPIPPTDDRSPIVLWAVLCAAALLGICALLIFRKRRASGRE